MHAERMVRSRALKAEIRVAASIMLLLGITLFQMAGLPQPITGPVVNAALFSAALLLGPGCGVAVGLFTPIVALARGILPAPLAPMVPFIALGNGLMVALYAALRGRYGDGAGVIAGSLGKFLLLATAVNVFVQVPESIAVMMQWPQLLTALGGGFLTLALSAWVRKRRRHGSAN